MCVCVEDVGEFCNTAESVEMFCCVVECVWPQEPTRHGSSIAGTITLSAFKRQLKTHSSVLALDSAGCSCGCRVPSSGAVVTVQRVRR